MKLLHEKCEKDKAADKKLPSDSFIVSYKVEEKINYDIVRSRSPVEIFDHYYDKYKKGFKWLKQTKGKVRPNLWNNPNQPEKPKRKKRRKPSSQEGS